MCDCLLSLRIETLLFEINENEIIIDEDCPICLIPLKKNPENSCCCGYARKLKCGHYAHVSCQINKNPDFIRCSLCRKILTDSSIYYYIIHNIMVKKLPQGYQRLLSEEELEYLLKIHKIDYSPLIHGLTGLELIKDNDIELQKVFKYFWENKHKYSS